MLSWHQVPYQLGTFQWQVMKKESVLKEKENKRQGLIELWEVGGLGLENGSGLKPKSAEPTI